MNLSSSPAAASAAAAAVPRRRFLRDVSVGAGLLTNARLLAETTPSAPARPPYRGPKVILIRFGGGARRIESIDPRHTYTPYFCHELTKRGVLYPRMEIDQLMDLNTSHGEGTLNLITGRYEKYRDIGQTRGADFKFLGARFEASVPTVFEYLREAFDVPGHQALIVNSEDRGDEEFYNFSNHHLFGVNFRSQTLSLRQYKTWLLRQQFAAGKFHGRDLEQKQKQLRELETLDYRVSKTEKPGEALEGFWQRWRDYYGDTGLVNPRGDRLLTELSIRALKELKPQLLMVNYQDCDYVHWGHLSHYTRALSIMDDAIKQLIAAVEADPEYRDDTVFVIAPDCGRDNNPFVEVPCQHHFNTRSSHEIFALVFGKGVPKGVVVDKLAQQTSVASTIGAVMGFKTKFTEAPVLGEVLA